MRYKFAIGKEYTRRDLKLLTGQDADQMGGDWYTGYAELENEFFIFCTIGGAGRTGDDYGNYFIGEDLVWSTKKNKKRTSGQTKRLLSPNSIKYLFTRDNDGPVFTYKGIAKAKSVEGDLPVKVLWSINGTDSSPVYFARLCWNTLCWVRPSGSAPKSEVNTFASENGFGHEEWLFDFSRSLDGYQYGFIQGVRFSSKRLAGTTFSVELYSIAPGGDRFLVGRIKNLEAITQSAAEAVKMQFQKNGWLTLMSQQVADIGVNPEKIFSTFVFEQRMSKYMILLYGSLKRIGFTG
jgi:hypothetical protein